MFFESRLGRTAQLVHEYPATRGGNQDLGRASLAVAVGVLAFLVHVECMVRVLDQRDLDPLFQEARNELLDERGLAASRPACKSEGLQGDAVAPPQELPAPAVQPRQWGANCIALHSARSKSKSKML